MKFEYEKNLSEIQIVSIHGMTQSLYDQIKKFCLLRGKQYFLNWGLLNALVVKKKKKEKMYFPPLMVRTYERRYMYQIELFSWNLTKLGALISCPIKCVISLIQGKFWKIKCIQCNVLLRGS